MPQARGVRPAARSGARPALHPGGPHARGIRRSSYGSIHPSNHAIPAITGSEAKVVRNTVSRTIVSARR